MVVLQLNGHKLSQYEAFYNQQTLLAIISLLDKYFYVVKGFVTSLHGIQDNLNTIH